MPRPRGTMDHNGKRPGRKRTRYGFARGFTFHLDTICDTTYNMAEGGKAVSKWDIGKDSNAVKGFAL